MVQMKFVQKPSKQNFAYDITLISEGIKITEEMLNRVELLAIFIGLTMNKEKRNYMSYNHDKQINIKIMVTDFKYLGSWLDSSEKEISTRKAQA